MCVYVYTLFIIKFPIDILSKSTSSEAAANGTVPTSATTGESRDIAVPILSAVVGLLAIVILTMTFIALAVGVCVYMRRKNKGRVFPTEAILHITIMIWYK